MTSPGILVRVLWIVVLLAFSSVAQAGDATATWTVANGGGTSRRGDRFTKQTAGDRQRINVAAANTITILTGNVFSMSRSVQWSGSNTRFDNVVEASDDAGIHSAKFYGTYRKNRANVAGTRRVANNNNNNNEEPLKWKFYDDVEVDKNGEEVVITTADYKQNPTNEYGSKPEVTTYDLGGATLSDIPLATPAGFCTLPSYGLPGAKSKLHSQETNKTAPSGVTYPYKATYYIIVKKVTGNVKINVPAWTELTKASAGQKKEWNRFSKALMTHELGHRNNGRAGGQELIDTLSVASIEGYAQTRVQAKNIAVRAAKALKTDLRNKIFDAMNDGDDQYDVTTRHGATQGAVLNTSVR